MKNEVPQVPGLLPSSQLFGGDAEDTAMLSAMEGKAKEYLSSFEWCLEMKSSFFAGGIGGILAVFLFRIVPREHYIGEWMWVLVGDVPSAYCPLEDALKASAFLESYLGVCGRWCEMARLKISEPDGIPLDVKATPETADQLTLRLKLIGKLVLPRLHDFETRLANPS